MTLQAGFFNSSAQKMLHLDMEVRLAFHFNFDLKMHITQIYKIKQVIIFMWK